eukprot:TRINITY_DN16721_c0_g1_i1.p1 TRINITY_DN16721_c0_g1~~TRINITY_DN16721_c0_g1_i1.p1  ORF type:complete len:422 (+),score=98.55 TRINITY_DN16721_c0_g1_i1:659-1924(+)
MAAYLVCVSDTTSEVRTRAVMSELVRGHGLEPNSMCFNALLRSCASRERALSVVSEMVASCIQPNEHTWTAVLRVCSRSADVKGALATLDAMQAAGFPATVTSYTSVMSACSAADDFETLFETYDTMQENGIAVEEVALTVFLSACFRRVKTMDDRYYKLARTAFEQGLRSNRVHTIPICTRMMQIFGKVKDAASAAELRQYMRTEGIKWTDLVKEAHDMASVRAPLPHLEQPAPTTKMRFASGRAVVSTECAAVKDLLRCVREGRWGSVRASVQLAATQSGKLSSSAYLHEVLIGFCDSVLRSREDEFGPETVPLNRAGVCLMVAAAAVVCSRSSVYRSVAVPAGILQRFLPLAHRNLADELAADVAAVASALSVSTQRAIDAAAHRQQHAAAAVAPLERPPVVRVQPRQKSRGRRPGLY